MGSMEAVYAQLERAAAPTSDEHLERGALRDRGFEPAVQVFERDTGFYGPVRTVYWRYGQAWPASLAQQTWFIPVAMEHESSTPSLMERNYELLERHATERAEAERGAYPPESPQRFEHGQVRSPTGGWQVPAVRMIHGAGDPDDQITNANPPIVRVVFMLGDSPLTADYYTRRTFMRFPLSD